MVEPLKTKRNPSIIIHKSLNGNGTITDKSGCIFRETLDRVREVEGQTVGGGEAHRKCGNIFIYQNQPTCTVTRQCEEETYLTRKKGVTKTNKLSTNRKY